MTRAISLVLALSATGILMLAPFLVIHQMTPVVHALLPVILLGVTGAFVHGVGFKPHFTLWRALFSPWSAWPLLVGGSILILRQPLVSRLARDTRRQEIEASTNFQDRKARLADDIQTGIDRVGQYFVPRPDATRPMHGSSPDRVSSTVRYPGGRSKTCTPI